jgi:hypothetical protein
MAGARGVFVVSLLHPILNNFQTEDLGKRPVNDDFYPHLPFVGGTPEKSMAPRGVPCLGVMPFSASLGRRGMRVPGVEVIPPSCLTRDK